MRQLAILCAVAFVASACSNSSAAVPTTTAISHPAGATDVVLQLGAYQFDGEPDRFIRGPEVVVYGDRTVDANLYRGIVNGTATFHLVTGSLTEATIQDLLHRASDLPRTTQVGIPAPDAAPVVLDVGDQEWEINDLATEPFASYVDHLRSVVDAAATNPWKPSRWIVRPFGAKVCSVVTERSGIGGYNAPVYPHVLSKYALGDLTC